VATQGEGNVTLNAISEVAEAHAHIDREIGGKTLLTEFRDAVAARGDKPALHWRTADGWHALTWREYEQQVRRAAYGLESLGLKPGAFGVILIRNRPEHVLADLALLFARGVPVSLYNTLASDQIAYIAGHCEAEVAFVEDSGMLARLEAVRAQLPKLRHVVLIEGSAPGTIGWNELLERGDRAARQATQQPDWFDAAYAEVQPDDLITLIYTSGTTGPPKGVMDTHRQVLWMSASGNVRLPEASPEDRHLSYLPLAHAFERYSGYWNAIVRRTEVFFCPDMQ
jgi:long-chain acyl-CoA synthetase